MQVIDVGQRFRKAGAINIVWQVSSVFEGTDGMRYAQLVRIDDGSMRKTMAVSALAENADYLPVAPSPGAG